jgi:hypothetical protein
MEDGNIASESLCAQCGASVEVGQIFCKQCGGTVRPPAPFVTSVAESPSARPKRKWISLKWSLIAVVLLFGYFMWQCGSGIKAGARLSDEAVRHFHSQLDSEAYGDIVRDSDEAFQNSENRDELVASQIVTATSCPLLAIMMPTAPLLRSHRRADDTFNLRTTVLIV